MKAPRIAYAIGHLESGLVENAEKSRGTAGRERRMAWRAMAACLTVFVLAGALLIPLWNRGTPTMIGGLERHYGSTVKSTTEAVIDFPWEYKLVYEKFSSLSYGGVTYRASGRAIGEALLGPTLGHGTAVATDGADIHTEAFEVKEILGVSPKRMAAIGMEGRYYVYINSTAAQPSTLGELLDAYALSDLMPLLRFSVNDGSKERGDYQLADDAYLYSLLSECRSAEAYTEADWTRSDRSHLSFTATSEALGVYKKAFYVTEDGYVATNILGRLYVYDIGKDKADSILRYAKANATKAEREQYEYYVAGTLTEIGDGYILVDDTVLCKDKRDGVVFRINTEEPRIGRYLACCDLGLGDTVIVSFQGDLLMEEGYTVSGAVSIRKGEIANGTWITPE